MGGVVVSADYSESHPTTDPPEDIEHHELLGKRVQTPEGYQFIVHRVMRLGERIVAQPIDFLAVQGFSKWRKVTRFIWPCHDLKEIPHTTHYASNDGLCHNCGKPVNIDYWIAQGGDIDEFYSMLEEWEAKRPTDWCDVEFLPRPE